MVVESVYTGAVGLDQYMRLRDHAIRTTKGAVGLVIRLDTCLLISPPPPVVLDTWGDNPCAGAIVVSPEQMSLVEDHARALSILGVRRTVWLASELRLAYEWAAARAALSGSPA